MVDIGSQKLPGRVLGTLGGPRLLKKSILVRFYLHFGAHFGLIWVPVWTIFLMSFPRRLPEGSWGGSGTIAVRFWLHFGNLVGPFWLTSGLS